MADGQNECERPAERMEKALLRARYLIGCQVERGDYAGEPMPTDEEWEACFDQIDEALPAIDP